MTERGVGPAMITLPFRVCRAGLMRRFIYSSPTYRGGNNQAKKPNNKSRESRAHDFATSHTNGRGAARPPHRPPHHSLDICAHANLPRHHTDRVVGQPHRLSRRAVFELVVEVDDKLVLAIRRLVRNDGGRVVVGWLRLARHTVRPPEYRRSPPDKRGATYNGNFTCLAPGLHISNCALGHAATVDRLQKILDGTECEA